MSVCSRVLNEEPLNMCSKCLVNKSPVCFFTVRSEAPASLWRKMIKIFCVSGVQPHWWRRLRPPAEPAEPASVSSLASRLFVASRQKLECCSADWIHSFTLTWWKQTSWSQLKQSVRNVSVQPSQPHAGLLLRNGSGAGLSSRSFKHFNLVHWRWSSNMLSDVSSTETLLPSAAAPRPAWSSCRTHCGQLDSPSSTGGPGGLGEGSRLFWGCSIGILVGSRKF